MFMQFMPVNDKHTKMREKLSQICEDSSASFESKKG